MNALDLGWLLGNQHNLDMLDLRDVRLEEREIGDGEIPLHEAAARLFNQTPVKQENSEQNHILSAEQCSVIEEIYLNAALIPYEL